MQQVAVDLLHLKAYSVVDIYSPLQKVISMKKVALLVSVGLVWLVSHCQKGEPFDLPEQASNVAEISQIVGWKLFRQEQLAKPKQNVLISPYSVSTAFSMALNGASGKTAEEIQAFLGVASWSVNKLNADHLALNHQLTRQSGHPTVTVANRYFYDPKRISVREDFVKTLQAYYHSGYDALDFKAEQQALQQINQWVKSSTNGKIDKILDRITDYDVAFLINALHFKADWAEGFAPELTREAPFTRADGSKTRAHFVYAERPFTVATTSQFSMIDIPFRDSTYSLSFIQPSPTNKNPQWHLTLSTSHWRSLYDSVVYTRAEVAFPKLKLSYENDLIESMMALEVQAPFDNRKADFSLMGTHPGGQNIFIKQIKHKAILNVDEKGAEGAAVTSIGFSVTSLSPRFWFDKPFVLVLRHIPTNAILFLGYVADPTQ